MPKIFLIFSLTLILSNEILAQFKDSSDILDVNFPALLSRADLTYTKPVSRSEEGMPIGNGRMGSLVWTTSSALRFQINRVDVFANNSASNSFFERHTDYCGGIGFADIDFVSASEDVFSEKNFRQHLSCYDGLVTVNGNGISASILAWNEQDVMVVQLEDKRSNPGPILAQLRALRLPITKKGNHSAISSVKVIDNKIALTQEFREDSYYCGSALVIEIQGLDTKAEKTSESNVRLITAGGNNKFTVFMASAASFDPKDDLVNAAIKKLDSAKSKGYEGLLQSNKSWWYDFWNRSFVHLHSRDGMADLLEEHYNYYLYVMASTSRGAYPAKFNGMLWTTGGDERKWGNMFWGANQSCLYNALFPTNRVELMDPMFNMYSSMYDDCALAARQQWGSKGIFIGETVSFDGIPALPEHIALEMRELYLAQKPWKERSPEFNDYALTKLPFLSRWNWKEDDGWREGRWYTSDKGGGPFGHVTHIFSRGAKIAYQYWLRYEYTKDEIWLRDRAYPILKGVAEFYLNFPNIKKEQDGNYHIYNVNDNESVWGGHNTIEELSAMMGIFPVVIHAAEILNVDTDLLPIWREFLDNLSPLPLSTDYSNSNGSSGIKWVRSLPPMVQREW